MASVGLMIGATIIMRISKKRIYALTCLVPLAYLFVTVNYAGYWMISNVYLAAGTRGYNLFNAVIASSMMVLGLVIMVASVKRWVVLWKARGESAAIRRAHAPPQPDPSSRKRPAGRFQAALPTRASHPNATNGFTL